MKLSAGAWAAILTGMLAFAHFTIITLTIHLNHDVSWILYGAGRMLNGAVFGRDIVDVNPPLVWWLSLPAALVAQNSGLTPSLAFKLQVLLLVFACIWLIHVLRPAIRAWQLALLLAILLITPAYHFGQREHLMAILTLPYVISLLSGKNDEGAAAARLAAGIMAGIGFALKPYFLVIPLLLEAYRLVKTRSPSSLIRMETLSIAAVGLAYAAAVWLWARDYVLTVAPQAMIVYPAYGNPFFSAARTIIFSLGLVFLGCFLINGTRDWKRQPLPPLILAAVGAALAAMLQSKGWAYHRLPITLFGLSCLAVALPGRNVAPARIAALLLGGVLLSENTCKYVPDMRSANGQEALINHLTALMRSMPQPGRVAAFNTSPRIIHSAVLAAGAEWIAPACCLYALPAAIRFRTPETKRIARNQLDALLARWKQEPPELVLVDISRYKLGFAHLAFSYLDYLKRDPRFAQALAPYREKERLAGYLVLQRRRHSPAENQPVEKQEIQRRNHQ